MKLLKNILLIIVLCTTPCWGLNNPYVNPPLSYFTLGVWVGDPNFGLTLQDAITSIGSSNATLHVPAGTYNISSNLTVPAKITLAPEQGAIFSVASGKTLTINGGLEAGHYQIFSLAGTGKADLAGAKIDKVSPEWWGAMPDNSTDCTAAIQAALDSGAKTILLSQGTYKTTSTLTVPLGVSLIGYNGHESIINPNGCDGLSLAYGTGSAAYYGTNKIVDFGIVGTNCGTKVAIKCLGTVNASDRLYGARIERLRIWNWGIGMYFRNLWFSRVRDCVLHPVDVGIKIAGPVLGVYFEGNHIEFGAVAGAPGTRTGAYIDGASDFSDGYHRPEDVQFTKNQFYNFNNQVQLVDCTFAVFTQNDLDASQSYGFYIANETNSQLIIQNNWIALGVTGIYGIRAFPAAGCAIGARNIKNNVLNGYFGGASTQYGISLETNQNSWNIEGNRLTHFVNNDIKIDGVSGQINIKHNVCRSTIPTISISIENTGPVPTYPTTVTVEDNEIAKAIYVNPAGNNGLIRIGRNTGYSYSYYIRGYTTIAAGHTSGATTYASLYGAPKDFADPATYGIYPVLRIASTDSDLGRVYGSAGVSSVTIKCTKAPAADKKVYWEVISYIHQEY